MSSAASLDESPRAVPVAARRPLYRRLYVQVLLAIGLGALLGYVRPDLGQQMKPLGDAFIKLIKMMIEPIIFTTVVVGVARMGSMKAVGRVGLKALVYFEVVSGISLLLGMVAANVVKPGAGIRLDLSDVAATAVQSIVAQKPASAVDFVMNVIPDSVVGAFSSGATLQVVFFSLLLGLALSTMGNKARPLTDLLDLGSKGLFHVISLIMLFAPIGAFGAMAYTIGKFGVGTLQQLGLLLATMYGTCVLFIFLVLGVIARVAGFSLWRFLRYIREELLIVFGTSTSESALPGLMAKLEAAGCSKSTVGLVVPTGYSFNLDGISIYLSLATVFIAQAANVHLSLQAQLGILTLLLLTSKGAAAVTGGGFIVLAATLSSIESLPVAGLALLFGVDRFMSEARAITNLIGNGVATVVIARWEGSLDRERLRAALDPERSTRPDAPP